MIAAILDRDPPSIGTLQPLAPHALERVVRQCLAKAPDDRWQSAHDLVTELKWIAEGVSESRLPTSRPAAKRREILTGAVSLAAGALAAGLAVWLVGRGSGSARSVHVAIPFDTIATISTLGATNPLAISPDGQFIALSAVRDGTRRLYIRSVFESTAKEIPSTEGADGPFFSPDGQWVAFVANSVLKRVALSGGAPQTIVAAPSVRGASWGPDGFIVFPLTFTVGLSRVPSGGGRVETLTTLTAEQKEKSHRFPQVLPGGKAVLFTIALTDISTFDDARIAVLSLDAKQHKVVVQGGTFGRYVSTGHLLYARGGALFATPFDLKRLEVTGAAVPVADHVSMSTQFGTAAFDVFAQWHPRLFAHTAIRTARSRAGRRSYGKKRSAPRY